MSLRGYGFLGGLLRSGREFVLFLHLAPEKLPAAQSVFAKAVPSSLGGWAHQSAPRFPATAPHCERAYWGKSAQTSRVASGGRLAAIVRLALPATRCFP